MTSAPVQRRALGLHQRRPCVFQVAGRVGTEGEQHEGDGRVVVKRAAVQRCPHVRRTGIKISAKLDEQPRHGG